MTPDRPLASVDVLHLATGEPPFLATLLASLGRLAVRSTLQVVPGPRRARSWRDYAAARRGLLARLEAAPPDLVHAHYGTCAAVAATQSRRPVVATFWGSDVYGNGRPSGAAVRLASRWAARRAAAVIVRNEEMARLLGRPCFVLPSGVALESIPLLPRDRARELLGLPQDRPLVLWPYDPARPEKDHALALAAMAALRREVPDAELLVVHGRPQAEYARHLAAADALLLTSRHEGSPNSVREAMAANLPVVATPVADVPALLAGVRHCAVAPDAAGLARALAPVLRGPVPPRSDGRAFRDRIDATVFARATRRVYEQVLAGALDHGEPGLRGWTPAGGPAQGHLP